ncbi:dipeptidase [Tengunoibacter tsumagoiensis]|uniref:Membrane dipeptidase n=1 Tax=Tengunoibacter tsumagoiensis TaxID=2014871 RepID=A0A402A6C4_9CHLR|nr:dipeptidase [Tengunoibacter tsumagoiensis]GCE14684.1 membrane dipeptidase [Tengunoibacter tsumagoiensis]
MFLYQTLIGHSDTLYNLSHFHPDVQPGEQNSSLDERLHTYFFEHGQDGDIDYPRALTGALIGAFFAIFVPNLDKTTVQTINPEEIPEDRWYERYIDPPLDFSYAQQFTLTEMAYLIRLEACSAGRLKIVRMVTEIEACFNQGVFSAIMHIEGCEGIDPELNNLQIFYQAGLRSLGPVWSRHNVFGYGVPLVFGRTPEAGPGLTDVGKELVRACNQLGIVLDLSHLNEQGFWDVARLSTAPLVATHSNAHALCPSSRNLTDKQLEAIRESDGLVGVNFNVRDLRSDGARNPDVPLELVVKHIDYLVDKLGIERVALGTDYDGALMPTCLSDVSKLPVLYKALAERGYDEHALNRLARENWLRVLRKIWR